MPVASHELSADFPADPTVDPTVDTTADTTAGADKVLAGRCPLCGGANACAMVAPAADAASGAPCWCTTVVIAPATLAAIPAPLRGVACLCRACAERSPPPTPG